MGIIAPGRYADVLLVKDLRHFTVETVFAKGIEVAREGKLLIELPKIEYADWACQSVHLKRPIVAEDFRLPANNGAEVIANVIGVIENQAPTRHLKIKMPVVDGEIKPEIKRDIDKIALVERHHASGKVQVGLVSGFGFSRPCAIATTVAHDSHQMIVVGTDEEDMALAANTLAECGGGQVVVSQGKVLGKVELPIGGLMSNERAEVVARKAASVLEGFKLCGCELDNPNMKLSLLGLVVIPELRISDLGLVDVTKFDFIPVIEPIR